MFGFDDKASVLFRESLASKGELSIVCPPWNPCLFNNGRAGSSTARSRAPEGGTGGGGDGRGKRGSSGGSLGKRRVCSRLSRYRSKKVKLV